ncbi:uncharacterized protein TRAVEDRAFT_51045 [Trametes versicolor FP-101664 SS1]|uniref:uncharacterized protein n=1 Tax=Trametes versicolor (strain FP-101664) TaxID=717944 RepID=UPI000462272C|nr:uncharacterized protein TRAVEDRAFT_51045 [Trametes versicolor FP-101664 SS1]EIW54909.1 hypothetical protein TRAVEDRAFT_51045 [Trametes versicolor FP-101664 SS1]
MKLPTNKSRSLRIQCHPKLKIDPPTTLKALYYGSQSAHPSLVDVVTVIQRRGNAQPTKPFPALECVLGTTTPIHECLVECIADSGSRTFIVAIQERPGTPNATLIETLRLPGEDWCMEVIVMQLGPDGSVVDFGSGGDQLNLAKNAVCRLLAQIHHLLRVESEIGQPFLFPANLRVDSAAPVRR